MNPLFLWKPRTLQKQKLWTNIPHEHKCVTCKQNFNKSDSKDKMPKEGWSQG